MTHSRVARLHLIGPLDGVVDSEAYPAIAARAAGAGSLAVQVRLPGAPGGEVLGLAREVRSRLPDGVTTDILVNDRIDVAQIVGAAGVHLGERAISVAEARELVGAGLLIGRSVHDVQGAERAEVDGADYVLAGHVFETNSKRGLPGRGLDWLAEVAAAVSIPVIAIGGINLGRVADVLAAGAWGVAVGREILESADPAGTTRGLLEIIAKNRGM